MTCILLSYISNTDVTCHSPIAIRLSWFLYFCQGWTVFFSGASLPTPTFFFLTYAFCATLMTVFQYCLFGFFEIFSCFYFFHFSHSSNFILKVYVLGTSFYPFIFYFLFSLTPPTVEGSSLPPLFHSGLSSGSPGPMSPFARSAIC